MNRLRGAAARIAASFACVAWAGSAAGQEARTFAAAGGFDLTRDSDSFHSDRARVGGLYYENPWSYSGVTVQSNRYSQDGFRMDVPGVLGVYRDVRRDTLAGVDVQAGVARVSGRLRAIGDASWRIMPAPTTAVDFLASADLVETPLALDRGIGYGFFAAGVEQQLGERFTVTGLAGYQPFTDGNARTHLRGRLIWLAVPEQGITVQLRYKQYTSSDSDVGGAYFNPDRYRQWLGVAAVRKQYAGWVFSGALGAGQEYISGSGSNGSYLAEARAEGPLAGRARLVLHAGYYRAAGFIEGPDYAYRSIGASVVVPF